MASLLDIANKLKQRIAANLNPQTYIQQARVVGQRNIQPFLNKPLSQPTQRTVNNLLQIPQKINAPFNQQSFPRIQQLGQALQKVNLPGTDLTSPWTALAPGLALPKMVGQQLQSYGNTLQRFSTPQGRQASITGFKQIPKQVSMIGRGGGTQLLNNPAVEDLLNVADFVPAGAIAEKVGGKALAMLPTGASAGKISISLPLDVFARRSTLLDTNDLRIMDEYVDVIKRGRKLGQPLATDATNIAHHLGLDPGATNKTLAKQFEEMMPYIEKVRKETGGINFGAEIGGKQPKGVGGVKATEKVAQKATKIPETPQEVQQELRKALPETPVTSVQSKTVRSSATTIAKDKYAFNINKPKLGLQGKDAKKLDEVVEKMKPVLEARKGKPLTNDEIIKGGRKAVMLDEVMGRDQAASFSKSLQATRNFVRSASKKKGVTPEYLAQIEILSSTAADTGRKLRSFAVNAEDAGVKEAILIDLKKLGIETQRLVDAGKSVDWEDAAQVTAFYRKFKPADFLEKLQEYRYVNMLSSPNTQIINTFGNFLQGAVVTPTEYTVRGGLDFARARLTGTEQKYFASQGVDYAKGFWKSLPTAWSKFSKVVKGEGGLLKPDVEFIPTGTSKLHKLYTTPLRMLEASDQFFRTMISGGEKASLAKSGLSEAEILKKATQTADYRTFRQAFDPEGKLGQGDLLKVWDKWNSAINQLRRLPGGKWIVPFLQTPTNILKQGVEYSPLGLATMKGAKEPVEQLAKAVLGSSVFVGAYAIAESGLTTWDAPANYKDRQKFYDAGLQPYSVKIGDTWYSYSKLGPISYPIAMASAMKWAKDNGADDNFLTTTAVGMGGFLQFFADQSYMQGIGDVIDAVRGDEFKQGRALANIPSQVIPYRALQGWLARLVDPIYRKSTGGGVGEQTLKSIKTQIPFVSKTLEPYTNLSGEPSQRSLPLVNAFSPIKVSQEKVSFGTKSEPALKTALPTRTPELEVLYKDALRTVNSYPDNKTKAQYGLVDKSLEEYQSEFDTANAMLKRIKKEQPEKVFEIELKSYDKASGSTTEDRAKWAAEQLKNGVDIEKLYEGQVLTKSVVEALNETYGLNLDKYNYGTGFRTLGGTGSGKKITVSAPKVKPFKLKASPAFKFSKLPAPPAIKTKPTKAALTLPKAQAYQPKINIPVRWL